MNYPLFVAIALASLYWSTSGFARRMNDDNSAPHENGDTASASSTSPGHPTLEIKYDDTYRSKVRWSEGEINYQTEDGKWWIAKKTEVAAEDGERKQGKDTMVKYQKGDVLFEVVGLGWYKVDPAKFPKPKEDEMSDVDKDFIARVQKIRPNLRFDAQLYKAAKKRVRAMVGYEPQHHPQNVDPHADRNGKMPNAYAIEAGYPLPYSNGGNQIESIYWGTADAQSTLNGWNNSYHHRKHVWGSDRAGNIDAFNMYRDDFAAASYRNAKGETCWVVITSKRGQLAQR